jgi:Ca-activated chloride channel family protein
MNPTRDRRSVRRALCLACIPAAVAATAFVACYPTHERVAAMYAPPGPSGPRAALGDVGVGTESYARIAENVFHDVGERPLSTFSIDVDTASYANVRRFLRDRRLPPADAVRLEELVNYFRYAYPPPPAGEPLAVSSEVGPCPWDPAHRLVRIGLRARALPEGAAPRRNLTFLVDVSGSMFEPRKLPLVKRALALLADQLDENDRVAIVVYAGSSGLVLPPTPGSAKERILGALAALEGGGSTNGGEGIRLAYAQARRSFVPGGVNRVVLATDGDFNVGVTSREELLGLIEAERRSGVALTVLGFGMGNIKDDTMEMLADKGNGNYAYIDSLAEARKVLVEEAAGTLVTVASDVKIQVEMNRAEVRSYRLLGYENRLLRDEEFDDDAADAGELGVGQTVTALYEVVPAAAGEREERAAASGPAAARLMTVKVRYKAAGDRSERREFAVRDGGARLDATSNDFRFAAAVATFTMSLRQSPHRGQATLALATALAERALPPGSDEHRLEFLSLVEAARALAGEHEASAASARAE